MTVEAPYSIEIADTTILSTLRGFWNVATFDDFMRDMRVAERRFGATHIYSASLCDLRAFPVQRLEVAERFTAYLAEPRSFARKTAIVVSAGMISLQAKRVATDPRRAFFGSTFEALEWLNVR